MQAAQPGAGGAAVEADGKWILAKVDVDATPSRPAALQVQSIPMVVAVIGGQLVDGFLGAMPEAQVRQWLGQVMGVAEKAGLVPPGSGDTEADESEYDAADQIGLGLRRGPRGHGTRRPGRRRQRFRARAGRVAGRPDRQGGLAQVNLIRRVSSYDQARSRRDAAKRPGDVQAQIAVADIDLASGRIEEAFDRLLGVVRRTSGEDRDRARAHLVGLFDILPPRDPRVTKARSTLSALLF